MEAEKYKNHQAKVVKVVEEDFGNRYTRKFLVTLSSANYQNTHTALHAEGVPQIKDKHPEDALIIVTRTECIQITDTFVEVWIYYKPKAEVLECSNETPEAEKCGNCFYSIAGAGSGECHRNAPVALMELSVVGELAESIIKTVWPAVQEDDWCGEFTRAAIKDGKGVGE